METLVQNDEAVFAALAGTIIIGILGLAMVVLIIAGTWKIYTKAGKPGWAALIPIYNTVILLEVVKKPLWWIILMFIPIVNFIILIIVYVELAKAFGKGVGFALGLIFFSFIFIPILGFGDAKYIYGTDTTTPEDHLVSDKN